MKEPLLKIDDSRFDPAGRWVLVVAMFVFGTMSYTGQFPDVGKVFFRLQWMFPFLVFWAAVAYGAQFKVPLLVATLVSTLYVTPRFSGFQIGGLDSGIAIVAILIFYFVVYGRDRPEIMKGSILWIAVIVLGFWSLNITISASAGRIGFYMFGQSALFFSAFIIFLIHHNNARYYLVVMIFGVAISALANPWLGSSEIKVLMDSGARFKIYLNFSPKQLVDVVGLVIFAALGKHSFFLLGLHDRQDVPLRVYILLISGAFLLLFCNKYNLYLHPDADIGRISILSEFRINYIMYIFLGIVFGYRSILIIFFILSISHYFGTYLFPGIAISLGEYFDANWKLVVETGGGVLEALKDFCVEFVTFVILAMIGDQVRRTVGSTVTFRS